MFDGHGFLRGERQRLGAGMAIGLLLTLFASTGYSHRRWAGHRPFAFDEYTWFDTVGVVLGLAIATYSLTVWWQLGTQLDRLEATQDYRFFLRAGAPRSIHGLLLLVAARDGAVDSRERDVVHRVLLRDLTAKVMPQDLKNWDVAATERDPIATATRLAKLLEPAERLAVLRWCRDVAAADGAVDARESELLRDLARILGPEPSAR